MIGAMGLQLGDARRRERMIVNPSGRGFTSHGRAHVVARCVAPAHNTSNTTRHSKRYMFAFHDGQRRQSPPIHPECQPDSPKKQPAETKTNKWTNHQAKLNHQEPTRRAPTRTALSEAQPLHTRARAPAKSDVTQAGSQAYAMTRRPNSAASAVRQTTTNSACAPRPPPWLHHAGDARARHR